MTQKRQRKRLIGITLSIFAVICAICATYVFWVRQPTPATISVQTYEQIPRIELFSENGDSVTLPANVYTVVFYMDASCPSCTSHIPFMKRVSEVFRGKEFQFRTIWENAIPKGTGIDPDENWTLQGKARLSMASPSMLVIDPVGCVAFQGLLEERYLVQYLLGISKNDYLKNAIDITASLIGDLGESGTLVEFYANGCSDCEIAIQQSSAFTQERKMNLFVVSDDSRYPIFENRLHDPGILSTLLGIEKAPAFLAIFPDMTWKITYELDELAEIPQALH